MSGHGRGFKGQQRGGRGGNLGGRGGNRGEGAKRPKMDRVDFVQKDNLSNVYYIGQDAPKSKDIIEFIRTTYDFIACDFSMTSWLMTYNFRTYDFMAYHFRAYNFNNQFSNISFHR